MFMWQVADKNAVTLKCFRICRGGLWMWQEEAVQLVVEIMDEYSLNQEDVDTIHEISKFKVC